MKVLMGNKKHTLIFVRCHLPVCNEHLRVGEVNHRTSWKFGNSPKQMEVWSKTRNLMILNGELSIAIVHEKLGIWSIIGLGFKPFLGEEKRVSLIRRNGQTWCKSVVYYEQMRFCVLDHIFSMDSGFGVSEIWVIANVLWWRKNDEKPPDCGVPFFQSNPNAGLAWQIGS